MSPRAVERLESGHPWIFTSDVVDRGGACPGDAVHIVDHRGRPSGTAHFSSSSQITLRVLSRASITPDAAFFRERIQKALAFRQRIAHDTDAYRLVFSEADLLPGLIVDRYRDCLVVQTLSQGMDRAKDDIVAVLVELLNPAAILARNDAAVRKHESLPIETAVWHGEVPDAIPVRMNGFDLEVNPLQGQKTGVYLDQRENYLAVARHARGRALDCFTSTGGFALHMARSCDSVEAVDSSETALRAASANALRNRISNVTFREADAFDLLAGYAAARQRFDAVVLDPPAFTKTRGGVEAAARGYKDINLRALKLLGAGGILTACSCSHHFTEALLLETVAQAALDAGKTLRILERRTQAQDHPILLTVPETLYLKCIIFEVL